MVPGLWRHFSQIVRILHRLLSILGTTGVAAVGIHIDLLFLLHGLLLIAFFGVLWYDNQKEGILCLISP